MFTKLSLGILKDSLLVLLVGIVLIPSPLHQLVFILEALGICDDVLWFGSLLLQLIVLDPQWTLSLWKPMVFSSGAFPYVISLIISSPYCSPPIVYLFVLCSTFQDGSTFYLSY